MFYDYIINYTVIFVEKMREAFAVVGRLVKTLLRETRRSSSLTERPTEIYKTLVCKLFTMILNGFS